MHVLCPDCSSKCEVDCHSTPPHWVNCYNHRPRRKVHVTWAALRYPSGAPVVARDDEGNG